MIKKLLIATPHKSFGELLASSLSKDEFNTTISLTPRQALDLEDLDLAIIDADIDEVGLETFYEALYEKSPRLGTLFIHSLNQHPTIGNSLNKRILYLSRPFNQVELMEALNRINNWPNDFDPISPEFNPQKPSLLTGDNWYLDEIAIKDRLENLKPSQVIRGVLLLSSENVFSSPMEIHPDSIQSVYDMLAANLDKKSGDTLVKFITLDSVEYLLIAAPFFNLGILAVFFNHEIKFSLAKKMADDLAERLIAIHPDAAEHEPILYGETWNADAKQVQSGIQTSEEVLQDGNSAATTTFHYEDNIDPTLSFPWNAALKENSAGNMTVLSDASSPSTNALDGTQPKPGEKQNLTSSMSENQWAAPDYSPQPSLQSISSEEDTQPLAIKFNNQSTANPFDSSRFETDNLKMTSYSFLMISGYPNYRLEGEPARKVGDEIRFVCKDNGWGLTFLGIHRDYIQISIKVPENMPPVLILKLLRERTTDILLKEFSEIEKELNQGDFWASGQLITTGNDLEII